eukprot:761558-Hanusia_phi.AAC.1
MFKGGWVWWGVVNAPPWTASMADAGRWDEAREGGKRYGRMAWRREEEGVEDRKEVELVRSGEGKQMERARQNRKRSEVPSKKIREGAARIAGAGGREQGAVARGQERDQEDHLE